MNQHLPPTRVDSLSNGLRVLTRELHHAPLVTAMVWYSVGSRDEGPGTTGISHFLEHMMFKGTPRFPYGAIEEGVKRRGGRWNAFTSFDYTAYYEVLPARHLEYGLEVEADRMVNMCFDPDLTRRERGIIVSEREGGENNPQTWLIEAFLAQAYTEFPYRHMILGHKDDIKATTAEVLTAHYNRFYRPNNATLVVTGDFDSDHLLELATKHFGHLSRGPQVEGVSVVEPEQTAERRLEVRRPGPNPVLIAGYKIPAAMHPDQPAINVLGAVLAGASSLSSGGAGMGKSSRFYRNLTGKGLATYASGNALTLQYPGLFLCSAMPVAGVELGRLEAALFEQVESVRQLPIPEEELARAKKQVRAQFLYGMESSMTQARILGATALTEGVERFDNTLEDLAAVTAEDVQRVAQAYLAPHRRTVGWFVPDDSVTIAPPAKAPESPAETGSTPAYQKAGSEQVNVPNLPSVGRILDQDRIVRSVLPMGSTLLVYPAETIPSIYIRVQLEAGPVNDPESRSGLAAMVGQLLTRGTRSYTAEQLAIKTDSLGISISADVGREVVVISLKCLPEDLQTGLELLDEVIRHPTFPEEEIGLLRERMLVGVRQANNDTRSVASRTLAEQLYPEGHPYRNPVSGTEASLTAISRAEVEAFHGRHFGPKGAIITAVGSVDAGRLAESLAAIFDGWSGGIGRPQIPEVPPTRSDRIHKTIEGKIQTDIALGWPLVSRKHPDYLALEFLTTLFGGNGSGAVSRLFRDVREKHGVSYYQYANFGGQLGPAAWAAHIGVNPARLEFTIDVLKQELRRLCEEPIPAHELESLKDFLENTPAVQHESSERVAARLAEMERFELGLDYVERYPRLVAGLTAEHLLKVAQRYFILDQMPLVTCGPEPTTLA